MAVDDKISGLTEGTILADADEFPFVDKDDPTDDPTHGTTKRSKWSTIKAALKTYFDGLYASITAKKGWRGHSHGLTLSNNTTDATNDIDIAAGVAWDNSNDVLLDLTSGLIKRLDASWAVGTNQGGLDTGSKANSTWYHVWLIGDGTTVDVLLSTSGTSPTMPSGYTFKVHIGWILTDGSGTIRPFLHAGTHWYWRAIIVDVNTTTPTNATLATMSVPPGEAVEWFGTIFVNNSVASIRGSVGPADGTSGNTNAIYTPAANTLHTSHARTLTNTSAQIRYDVGNTGGWTQFAIGTAGWIRLTR